MPALRGLDADKKIGLLARLAEFMVGERVVVLDLPRARRQVETGLREINALEGRDPNAVLDALQERSGVLRGWSQEEVEFAHNRLRSYLAARAFKDEEALRQPIEGALATADPDLPVLAAAMGSIKYRERLIDELLKEAEATPNIGGRCKSWRSAAAPPGNCPTIFANVRGISNERPCPRATRRRRRSLPNSGHGSCSS